MTADLQEERRLKVQAECDGAKNQVERNRLGQFATPRGLALQVVRHAVGLLPDSERISFLDPAVGTGAFFSALLTLVMPQQITRALGFEIDPVYGKPAREIWSRNGLQVRFEDFTQAPPPLRGSEKFSLVICNPPYVRHHHLSNEDKVRLRDAAQRACGAHINGLAGLYCYFLGIAQPWMAQNGIAAWLLPSEFMDVKYGLPVKDYLLSRVTLLRIHRFDPNDLQFGDALVSSAIVFFRNSAPPESHSVELTFGGPIQNPMQSRYVSLRQLRVEPKWTRLTDREPHRQKPLVTLADLFVIRRGLATGANNFFMLTPERIREHRLPAKFLNPILPSPRYLPCDEVLADQEGNPLLERKLFLLDCALPEDQVRERYPELWTYLEQGRASGVAKGYLCGSRSPWYTQENRPPPPFLCTYIGRSDTASGRPFRFILNHSRATAANVYLLLYPKPELAGALKKDPALARFVWQKLNEIESTTIVREGRVYGGGLHKLEPKELANVPADLIAKVLNSNYSPAPQQMALCEKA